MNAKKRNTNKQLRAVPLSHNHGGKSMSTVPVFRQQIEAGEVWFGLLGIEEKLNHIHAVATGGMAYCERLDKDGNEHDAVAAGMFILIQELASDFHHVLEMHSLLTVPEVQEAA